MIHAGIGGCKEDLNEAGVGLPALIHPQKQYLVQICACNLALPEQSCYLNKILSNKVILYCPQICAIIP